MRSRVARRGTWLAAAVGLTLMITACGGGNTNDQNTDEEAVIEGSSAPALAAMVKTDGAPTEPTGTLHFGSWISNNSFDPQLISTNQAVNLFAVYDPLFQIDEKHQPLPWLVAEWESASPTSVRLTLRDDVVFHDGSKFNAEALKANLERAKTITASANANMYDPIESVTVESEYVALVEFSRPYPNFFYNMATSAGFMISPKAIAEGKDLTQEPAGSGGWLFEADKYVPGSKQVYTANPNYWNPDAVRIQEIDITIITDPSARLNAYSTGQIDVITYVPDANKALVETDGSRVLSDLTIAVGILIQDREGTVVPAFGDERVRQAMALLADREGFNAAVLGGSGYPAGGFSAPGTLWYDESLNERGRDVEKAKQLLAGPRSPRPWWPSSRCSPTAASRRRSSICRCRSTPPHPVGVSTASPTSSRPPSTSTSGGRGRPPTTARTTRSS
jgi:peptide/nickel transport system substrate-binding protein